ncbi:MAG: D-alanyl-D-alanine carboxypeptidase/D-alanyl-D-alanine-endopeptidase [Candidatus Nanopelagicales bacterium]
MHRRAGSNPLSAIRLSAIPLATILAAGLLAVAPAVADTTPPPAPAPSILSPTVQREPRPTPEGVRSAIGRLVKRDLARASVIVLDPASSSVLFDQRGSKPRIPASTAKLATAAAALEVLGAGTTIPTIAYRDGDTVYLVGGGDPTLVRGKKRDTIDNGRASLTALAKAVAEDYGTQRAITVIYDASAFTGPALGPGWKSSFPSAGVAAPVSALVLDGGRVRPGASSRVTDPARQAAKDFSALLKSQGLKVKKTRKGALAASATEVARVESPPVVEIVEGFLTDSDNNYAEALAHLVGGKLLGDPSFAGGAQATVQVLAEAGLPIAGLTLVDGSGLSRRNLIPPALLAELLSDVVVGQDADLTPIGSSLAIAGFTGTLESRFGTAATADGRGFVHAKTGTLTGVTSLAGTVLDAEGRTLVFAMIDDKVKSIGKARATMDTIAATLATCGCD